MKLAAAFPIFCACALVAGCGSGSESESTPPSETAGNPATPNQGGQAPQPAPGGKSPESGEGGAGDEEPARSEVTISARDDKLSPAKLSVAAYLPVRIAFRSADGKEHAAKLDVDGRTYRVGASGSQAGALDLPGLKPGAYELVAERGAGRATITATSAPGP